MVVDTCRPAACALQVIFRIRILCTKYPSVRFDNDTAPHPYWLEFVESPILISRCGYSHQRIMILVEPPHLLNDSWSVSACVKEVSTSCIEQKGSSSFSVVDASVAFSTDGISLSEATPCSPRCLGCSVALLVLHGCCDEDTTDFLITCASFQPRLGCSFSSSGSFETICTDSLSRYNHQDCHSSIKIRSFFFI